MGRPIAMKKTPENVAVDKVFGNIDLLANILHLLPHKPLFRFKAVSNLWLTLISDPLFLINYTRHHRTSHPPSTFSHFYYDFTPVSLDGSTEIIPHIDRLEGDQLNAPDTNYLIILNSCNGLFLCKYSLCSWFIVFNPTTKKHRPFPTFGIGISVYSNEGKFVLAFDPLTSFNYKVVCFMHLPFDRKSFSKSDNIREKCLIAIFSSVSASWKRINLPAPSVGVTKSKRVFWNGAIHWISNTNFHVRFDVNEENLTWNQIPTDPNTFPEGDNIGYLGECDTGLLLIKFPRYGNYASVGEKCTFAILEMEKDSDCWVLKHHVNLEKLGPKVGLSDTRAWFTYNVLYILSEPDKDCFSLVLGVFGSSIILYSINNRNNHISTKVLENYAHGCHSPSRGKFFPFIPCLSPV